MKIVNPYARTTLLLDSAWMPINVITARAAFHHFLRNRITALDKNKNQFNFETWNEGEYTIEEDNIELSEEVLVSMYRDQPCLRSAKDVWALPTIAIVTERFFRKYRKREYTFDEMCKYYKNTCQICLDKFPKYELSIDHVDPRAKGGHNMTSNLTIACKRCNSRKGHQSPYFNKNGDLLKGTNLPNNYIFIEEGDMREEWKDFVWHT
jgi:5-methylcytosine-specific restriction endonuclease McrA